MKPDPCLINPGLSAVSVPYSGPQSPEEDSSSGGSTNSGEGEHAFLSPSSAFLNFDSESQYSPQRTDSPSHPLTASKHECAICGDRASGKHYGVHSCEGCKGFFKRTVRKELSYTCRENKRCIIDKRQRNRCQYCRYRKCLVAGMRREAVQEERQRNRERGRRLIESLSSENSMEVSVDKILEAEHCADYHDSVRSESKSFISREQLAADCQMVQLVAWAKRIPHFTGLPVDDQVCLLRYAWNELLLAAFSHRSVNVRNGLLLASGLLVERQSAHGAGVGPLFDRVLCELVAKFRDMKVDKTELGCLRAIVLYNSRAKGLKSTQKVEHLREQLFITLEDYCRKVYTHEPGRFARLLLRLPPLRSIGLKCLEHLFFHKVIGNAPVENVLKDMLLKPYD